MKDVRTDSRVGTQLLMVLDKQHRVLEVSQDKLEHAQLLNNFSDTHSTEKPSKAV